MSKIRLAVGLMSLSVITWLIQKVKVTIYFLPRDLQITLPVIIHKLRIHTAPPTRCTDYRRDVVHHACKVMQKPLQQGGFSDTGDIKLLSLPFTLDTGFLLPKPVCSKQLCPALCLSPVAHKPLTVLRFSFTDFPVSLFSWLLSNAALFYMKQKNSVCCLFLKATKPQSGV